MYIYIFNYQISLYYLLHTNYTYINNVIFTIKSKYIQIYTYAFILLIFHSNKEDNLKCGILVFIVGIW